APLAPRLRRPKPPAGRPRPLPRPPRPPPGTPPAPPAPPPLGLARPEGGRAVLAPERAVGLLARSAPALAPRADPAIATSLGVTSVSSPGELRARLGPRAGVSPSGDTAGVWGRPGAFMILPRGPPGSTA